MKLTHLAIREAVIAGRRVKPLRFFLQNSRILGDPLDAELSWVPRCHPTNLASQRNQVPNQKPFPLNVSPPVKRILRLVTRSCQSVRGGFFSSRPQTFMEFGAPRS